MNNCAEAVPTTEKEFRRWRLKQTFANEDLAIMAEWVERGMKLLAELDAIKAERPDLTHEMTRAHIARVRTDFEAAYRKSIVNTQGTAYGGH